MDDDVSSPFRRMSSRTRKVAPKMVAALASNDNRTQAARARLEALENDYTGIETVEINDDDEASLDDDDEGYLQKKHSKSTKRKTRQAKALENARRAPRNFLELLHEANLESLPPHVPSYLRAAVGLPSSTCRRHFCTVCGYASNYTCVRCGMRFCSPRCQHIHDDTRCQKFVA
ncbi:SWR1 complex subunit 6 [Euphorbia lathyris]|uniref:SWR1 complex subunit 6 n=1 Tax=Euphorbia lathyris TaxID=212925 RepID=UPI0033131ABB